MAHILEEAKMLVTLLSVVRLTPFYATKNSTWVDRRKKLKNQGQLLHLLLERCGRWTLREKRFAFDE